MSDHGLAKHEHRYVVQFFAIESQIRRYLRGKLRNESQVNDVLQEILVRLLQRAAQPDKPEIRSVPAVSHRIARNLVSEHFRRIEPECIDDVEDEQLLDEASSADLLADAWSHSVLLCKAIERLSPRIRHALICRFKYNMSYKDIARELGASEKSIGQFISRAVRRLAATMGAAPRRRAPKRRRIKEVAEE